MDLFILVSAFFTTQIVDIPSVIKKTAKATKKSCKSDPGNTKHIVINAMPAKTLGKEKIRRHILYLDLI